jgi:hypothetical protein
VSLGLPGRDVGYLLGTCLSVEDRRAAEHDLVSSYHARSGPTATLVADAWLLRGLRLSFGSYLEVVGDEPDARVRATVAAQSTTAVAEHLAGRATLVEVVGPPEVITELARLGRALVDRYGA